MIYGVVLNDHASVRKIGAALNDAPYKGAPKAPAMYLKPANTVRANGAEVPLPRGATELEIGATLGLVIGRAASRLMRDNALAAVSAVVLVGDLSLPHTSYYRPAIREKCFDGACPTGSPTPISAVANLERLVLITEIDGAIVEQRALTDLIRDPAQLLVDVSEFMTLNQGDVLLLGVSYLAPRAGIGSRVSIRAEGLNSLQFSLTAAGGAL